MEIHNVVQGSPEWKALRAKHLTASEAPVMMGASYHKTRDELLTEKKTGMEPEVSPALQDVYNRGHAAEAAIRPYIESVIGEDLFPATGTRGELLASFDGITFDELTVFEHKLWNEGLATSIEAGDLRPHYYWQLEQQLLVSGAEKVIFVCSDGTPENCVWMEYTAVPGRSEELLKGWKQFKKDLEDYKPPETKTQVSGRAIESLPALNVTLVGEVRATNLPAFRSHAMAVIESINTDLNTDEDFADAEVAVKFCRTAEQELAAVKNHALSQTASIDELFKAMDQIQESLRSKRLTLEKLVAERKKQIKAEIVGEARAALAADIEKANKEFHPIKVVIAMPDFAEAVKNKRTLESLRSAVNDELAKARIQLTDVRDEIRGAIKIIADAGEEYQALFHDRQTLVYHDHDHLRLIVQDRVNIFIAEQEAKLAREQAQVEARLAREQAAGEVELSKDLDSGRKAVLKKAPDAKGSGRPSDSEIIAVLSKHFNVPAPQVICWLSSMNLNDETKLVING